MKMTVIFLLTLLFILMFVVFYLFHKSYSSYLSKWSQYECGFTVMTPSRIPFSFQFFLLSILFLIFDIEIAMLFSFPMEHSNMKNIMYMSLFLIILMLGMSYEWYSGKLEWTK